MNDSKNVYKCYLSVVTQVHGDRFTADPGLHTPSHSAVRVNFMVVMDGNLHRFLGKQSGIAASSSLLGVQEVLVERKHYPFITLSYEE